MADYHFRCDRALHAVRAAHGEAGMKAVEHFLRAMGGKASLRWEEVVGVSCSAECHLIADICQAAAPPAKVEAGHVD